MLLTKLLEGITWEGEAPECEIVGLTADSRQLEQGWVYVCQKGQSSMVTTLLKRHWNWVRPLW